MNQSLAQELAMLDPQEKRELLTSLTDEEANELLYQWSFWARPNQLPPDGEWIVWMLLAGRGFGKTRTGAEWSRGLIERKGYRRGAFIAPTASDARDVMVEGESGILAVCPPWFMPEYQPSKRRLVWPNGAMVTLYSADEPERLRGPQHDFIWADEVGSWRYPEAWDMAMFGLRLGLDPKVCVTTTPKPTKLVKDLVKAKTTVITKGSTYENLLNLAPSFIQTIVTKYEGTRLGRQELHAEVLEDVEGALWSQHQIDQYRIKLEDLPELIKVAVAIDPPQNSDEDSAECGIIVGGVDRNGEGYVLADCSIRETPLVWARTGVHAYHLHLADALVAEVNNGGEMVKTTIHTVDPNVNVVEVRATRSKSIRAEPISSLAEKGRIHHVGIHDDLEDQLCTWVPALAKSPDRLDAYVWLFTHLMDTVPPVGKSVEFKEDALYAYGAGKDRSW